MKRLFLFAIAFVTITLLFIGNDRLPMTKFVRAGSGDTVSGWAWGDTIGWISFNCTNVANECARSNYGVNIDPATGKFSGYAWADNLGWISFTRDGTMGTPPALPYNGAEDYSARLTFGTNTIIGWGKILAMGDRGWLQFRGTTVDPVTGQLSGWLWNGNTDGSGVGWVALSNVMVATSVTNVAPSVPAPTAINQTPIDGTAAPLDTGKTLLATVEPVTSLTPLLAWSPFADPNGATDVQQAYTIIVEEQRPDGTWSVLYDRTVANDGNTFRYPLDAPRPEFGQTYRWKVRVEDRNGLWSPFSDPTVFVAPTHAVPNTQFDAPSTGANVGDTIQLTDHTVVAPSTAITKWQWSFGDGTTLENPTPGVAHAADQAGNPIGPDYQNPTHSYATEGTYMATLTVTDREGYVVKKIVTVTVGSGTALPIWERIIPF